jgi:hypothetical protein
MSTTPLDDKLRDFLNEVCESFYWEGANPEKVKRDEFPDWIAELKQAFADAGYMTPQERVDWHKKHFTQDHMTGQEWYDRFKTELQRQGPPTLELRMAYPEEIEANVLEAAQRAAGINERKRG